LAYVSIVRSELRFFLQGWSASYRLHIAFAAQVTAAQVEACSHWAAALDAGSPLFGDGVGLFRIINSRITGVVSTEISRSAGFKHYLVFGDAVGHGGDSDPPALSAGQALGVEWITGERGKGVNGRTYFPYLGSHVHDIIWVDQINPLAAQEVEVIANAWAFYTPTEVGGDPVVLARQRNKAPVNMLDSRRVTAVAVRRDKFVHQRLRVEWRRPFDLTP
jgi:hypothetical protein